MQIPIPELTVCKKSKALVSLLHDVSSLLNPSEANHVRDGKLTQPISQRRRFFLLCYALRPLDVLRISPQPKRNRTAQNAMQLGCNVSCNPRVAT